MWLPLPIPFWWMSSHRVNTSQFVFWDSVSTYTRFLHLTFPHIKVLTITIYHESRNISPSYMCVCIYVCLYIVLNVYTHTHTHTRMNCSDHLTQGLMYFCDFPGCASSKEPACQCRRYKRHKFDRWVGRSPGGGHGDPPQYSCLENIMNREDPSRLQSIGSYRVRHNWNDLAHMHSMHFQWSPIYL